MTASFLMVAFMAITMALLPLPEYYPSSKKEPAIEALSAAIRIHDWQTTATTTTQPPPTSEPSRPTPHHGSRSKPTNSTTPNSQEVVSPGISEARAVQSTAYCLRGTMANGQAVHEGAVAMNGVAFGTRYKVIETGKVYIVADRIGHSSQFDIWMSSCSNALAWGRKTVHIVREMG